METAAAVCKVADPRDQRRRVVVSHLYRLRFLPLLLLTAQSGDMQTGETFREFLGGAIGYYAMDCSRGPALDNPYQGFAGLSYNGKPSGFMVGMRLKPKEDSFIHGHMDQVELQNGKELLSYRVEMGSYDEEYHFVWKKAGKEAIRLYQFEDTAKHIQYVKDGVIPNTAIATPVYHHCRPSMLAPGQEW
jgi:hypothetical protein